MSWQLIHFIRSQSHLVMDLWLLLIKFAMNFLENLIQHAFNKTHQFWNTTRITRLVRIKISIFIYNLEWMKYKKFRSLLSRVHGRPVERWMQMCSSLLRFVYPFCNHLKGFILLCFIKKVVKDSKTRPRGFGESSEDLDQEIVPFGSMQLVFHESFRISIIQNVVKRKHHV